jgi:hypothetical protein
MFQRIGRRTEEFEVEKGSKTPQSRSEDGVVLDRKSP